MSVQTVVAPTTVREAVRPRVEHGHLRIHWMALGSAGMAANDCVWVPTEYAFLADVVLALGFSLAAAAKGADIAILAKPKEPDLLGKISRLDGKRRLIVYNDECDIGDMPDRCFDLATACVFDRESGKVVRIFDPLVKGCRAPGVGASYINVELADLDDSALSVNASRIASLR